MSNLGHLTLQPIFPPQPTNTSIQPLDFAIILNNTRTILMKKYLAHKIKYLHQHIAKEASNICFINRIFNIKIFENIIKSFETAQLYFERNHSILDLMQILTFLKIQQYKKQLIKDCIDNFDNYGFFILFELAQLYNQNQLKQRCLYQLINLEFQQLNFNRYDLMSCSQPIFQILIKLHQHYFKRNIIKGLDKEDLYSIITDFQQYNNIVLDAEKILSANLSSRQEQCNNNEENIIKKQKDNWQKFRTPSFDLSDLSQSINFIQIKQGKNTHTTKILRKKSQITYTIDSSIQNVQQLLLSTPKPSTPASQLPNKPKSYNKQNQNQSTTDTFSRIRVKSINSCCSLSPSTPDSIPNSQEQINERGEIDIFLNYSNNQNDIFLEE